jgi:hypothetical protein
MLIKKPIDFKKSLHFKIFSLLDYLNEWGLSSNELKVISALYDKDYELAQSISDQIIRMRVLFSKEIKDTIIEQIKIPYNSLNNILTVLRKKQFIINNAINEKLLLKLDKQEFDFTVKFINDQEKAK